MNEDIDDGRTGLVLAAGRGIRQGNERVPKPLLAVGGQPLILRVLAGLERAGCARTVVVLGHQGERIQRTLDAQYAGSSQVEFVSNPRFDLGNGISVLSARERLPDRFLLVMADHVFEDSVMDLVSERSSPPDGATVVIDSKLESIFDMDDATKVYVENGRVLNIGKGLTRFNAVDCGLFLAGTSLMAELDAVFQERGDASLSEGVLRLARDGRMGALDLGDRWWQDVDTPEMLAAAERLILEDSPATDADE